MKELKVIKNADISGVPDSEALELISRFARKTPDADEIYTFTVTLCDNDIDRDNERFSVESLHALKEMFTGVTGIFDHSMKSSDQTARIYKTQVVTDPSRSTAAGEEYTYLKAWCYMLRNDKNKELISEIDGGIKKEVSVSCSVSDKICSVCGKSMRSHECCHAPGEIINGKVCHAVLVNPTDAYEWSFVAVPAQRNAGVSKSLKKKQQYEKLTTASDTPEDVMKSVLSAENGVSLSPGQVHILREYVNSMEKNAEAGIQRRREAEKDIIAVSAFTLPDADTVMLGKILERLATDEVYMLKKALSGRAEKLAVFTPAFTSEKSKSFNDNSEFKI